MQSFDLWTEVELKSKIKVQKLQIKRRDKVVSKQNEEIRSLKKSLILRDSKIEKLKHANDISSGIYIFQWYVEY